MKNCTGCKFARWKRNAAGSLHPSGDGICTYSYKLPPLPASMYWSLRESISPMGGHINRKKEHPEHCTYYARSE
jgi:hypothetical protein